MEYIYFEVAGLQSGHHPLEAFVATQVSEKKQLLNELHRAIEDHSPGSVTLLVRKALILAALSNDSTYELLFELHLLGLDTWASSGNKETWQSRGVEDNEYVAKANATDRLMLNGKVETRPLDDIERTLLLLSEVEQMYAKAGHRDAATMSSQVESERILGRIRSRVTLFAAKTQRDLASQTDAASRTSHGHKIFIGHGSSGAWKEIASFLEERLCMPWDEFNREPTAGVAVVDRLQQMLDEACFAFLVMTAEDVQLDGTARARQNVVHEAGLFQGRLGFRRAILLLEEGCAEFSNVLGLGQIRYPKGDILGASEEIRRVLERENILPASG
jgi:predicted nucleotide-binding protein